MKSARLLACLAIGGGLTFCPDGSANPVGPVVQFGNVAFQGGPGALHINQFSPRAIVNWQTFSIGPGEITRINQPSARAAILNRVTSANPSEIFGSLQANGRVYLINPNGILVGREGRITAGQFVGSTRDVADREFLYGRGRARFSGSSSAPIRNEGEIRAESGGVYLIARSVENAGTLAAPRGGVGLAAGSEVLLQERGRPGISVVAGRSDGGAATGAGTGIDNSGLIEGARADLAAAGGNIYALAIANSGVIRATSVTRENGVVALRAAGGNIQNSGTLTARNSDGSGGQIRVEAGHAADNQATVSSTGVMDARGDAAGTRGGMVQITGDRVTLEGTAQVDVSGRSGGGTALIGGGYQGRNPEVQNARQTEVGPDVVIRADALDRGNGGRAIVWSDESTRFAGSIYARGGPLGGNGGFAETSGKLSLTLPQGLTVDAGAPAGAGGSWLIDPTDIDIDAALAATIVDSLGTDTTVTISTADGNITVSAQIEQMTSGATLILMADGAATTGNIQINAPITLAAGNLTLTAGANISQGPAGTLTVGGNTVLTAGGNITLTLAGNSFRNLTIPSAKAVELVNGSSDITDLVGSWDVTSLILTMNGALNQSGRGLRVAGTTRINANGHDVALESLENDFVGQVTINDGRDVKLVDENSLTVGGNSATLDARAGNPTQAGDLTLAGYATTGDLRGTATVNAGGSTGGHINQSGDVTVGGDAILHADRDVTLANMNNDFVGAVMVTADGVVTIKDRNSLTVGGSSGSLNAEALSGNLVLAGYDTGAGDLTGKASADISVTAAVTAGATMLIAGGDISQAAALMVGATTLEAVGNIKLDNLNNDFKNGVTVVRGAAVTLQDQNSLTVRGASASLNAEARSGDLELAGYDTGTGNLTGKASADISVTAAVTAGATMLIAGGDISQAAALMAGATTLDAVGNIRLDNVDNDFKNGVTVVRGAAVTLKDKNSLTVRGTSSSLNAEARSGDLELAGYDTGTGDLTGKASADISVTVAVTAGATMLMAGGNISQAAALMAGATTLEAVGNITLDNVNNDFKNAVTVVGGATVRLKDQNSLTVRGTSASLNAEARGGDLELAGYNTGTGDLTGKASADISVTVAVTAGATMLMAGGDISQAAALMAGATTLEAVGNITLGNVNNDFKNGVTVVAGAAVTLKDNNSLTVSGASASLDAEARAGDLVLAGYTTTGALAAKAIKSAGTMTTDGDILLTASVMAGGATTLTAGGDISQTAGLTVGGSTTLDAGGNITLNNVNNDFKNGVTVVAGAAVTLKDQNSLTVGGASASLDAEARAGDLVLAGYTTTGALAAKATKSAGTMTTDGNILLAGSVIAGGATTLTAGGTISQTAALTAGATRLEAVGNITLNNVNNDFKNGVTVVAGAAVTLKDQNSLTVGGASASLDAEARAGDLVLAGYTTTGSLTAKATKSAAMATDGDIRLTGLLRPGTVSGKLTLTADGDITQTGDAPIKAGNNVISATGRKVELLNSGNTGNANDSEVFGNPAGLFLLDETRNEHFFISGTEEETAQSILAQTTPSVAAPLADPGRTVVPDILPAIEPPPSRGVTTAGLQVYGERVQKEADKKAKGTIKLLR